jgi:hypothetical protein
MAISAEQIVASINRLFTSQEQMEAVFKFLLLRGTVAELQTKRDALRDTQIAASQEYEAQIQAIEAEIIKAETAIKAGVK